MKRHQRGMSLIELMVAILISTLLIIGVMDLFNRTSASDRANTELARMQESGRLALEIIGQDARRAGFQGCMASDTTTILPDGSTLPGDAITSTASTNITFRYAEPGSGCDNEPVAFEPAITYLNTPTGISRIIGAAPPDPILDNASLEVSFLPDPDNIQSATSVLIEIVVSDSRNSDEALNPRTFSATYDLRNRVQ